MKNRLLRLDIDDWEADGPRYRKLDPSKVAMLAESMAKIGLQHPITAWVQEDHPGPDIYHLLTGLHRLEAAKKLGWDQIDVLVVDLSEIDRKRWEIAENLHRAELTPLERDQHVAEWIRLTEEVDQSAQPAPIESKRKDGRGHRKQSGVRAAARELGIDRDDARRAVKVASLTDEAKEVARETGLDKNRSALLKAASKPPEQQAQVLKEYPKRTAKKKVTKNTAAGLSPSLKAMIKSVEAYLASVSKSEDERARALLAEFSDAEAASYAARLDLAIEVLKALRENLLVIVATGKATP